ncbi:unnamed protein product [Pedinophyceae sp. YPF-701]|nr:unnamed protein product [Pedinophyceae sp. YPF-701]
MGCAGSKDEGLGGGKIKDRYRTFQQVQEALRKNGLESSNLIIAIDYTASNTMQGMKTFGKPNLHDQGNPPNPYKQAISALAQTLSPFDEDQLIPVYGFGDARTHDNAVFHFNPGGRMCHGLEEILTRYSQLTPQLKFAGPTSFAPAVYEAMKIVQQSGNQYHILVILCDGGITGSGITGGARWSPQEEETIQAIIDASHVPLSIVAVGVGDGPWDQMEHLDDKIRNRQFDNFQFVDFVRVLKKSGGAGTTEGLAGFAAHALMEVPQQFRICTSLGYVGRPGPSHVPPKWASRMPLMPPDDATGGGGAPAFQAMPSANNYGGGPPPNMFQAVPSFNHAPAGGYPPAAGGGYPTVQKF